MAGTGYSEDDLRVSSDTDPQEILDFVERRTRNPFVVDGVTVFNYSSHTIDESAMREIVPRLYRDSYIIPFQLGAVWAVMYHHLPVKVRNLEYLQYDSRNGTYHPHRNFMRLITEDTAETVRKDLAEWINENTDYQNRFEFNAQAHPMDQYL